MSTSNVSPKKWAKKAKAVLPPPVKKTAEEIEAEDRAKVKRKLAALRLTPTPKQVYTKEQKEWAFDMLTQLSWEFRDSSHGEAYRRGSTMVMMGPARDCAYRDTTVYPGSGPSRLEVNPYFLLASY
jgi:hypothetical protein